MSLHSAVLHVASITVAAATVPALAQTMPSAQGGTPAGLTPVDQGLADVGPLGLSLRRLQLDFRRPTGFDRVFQFSGPVAGAAQTPASSNTGSLARVSGALTAVFPRSTYVTSREGQTFAAIPAGTRFLIGDPGRTLATETPAPASPSPAPTAANTAMNSSATARVDRVADRSATAAAPPSGTADRKRSTPSIVDDDGLRVRRVKSLLADAAASPVSPNSADGGS